jgi:hypothetical protein
MASRLEKNNIISNYQAIPNEDVKGISDFAESVTQLSANTIDFGVYADGDGVHLVKNSYLNLDSMGFPLTVKTDFRIK